MKNSQITSKITLAISFFVAFTTISFGQSYKISGIVKDTTNTPISDATVYVTSVKDSTVINYSITEKDGKFVIDGNTNAQKINFYISFPGFARYRKTLTLKDDGSTYNLGKITLKEMTETLGVVSIQGVAPPVVLKKDTLEFNVDSYKTKADATLEDVFKKLPGVTVDNDGTIKVNGKSITKIMVNGKDFFGSDPKIASKNLPKDLIEKIQVVDAKSRAQEFTGRESDSDDKMINLVVEKENNKGLFARMSAGVGTNDRYSVNGIANYFKQDMRLSALGSTNNINSVGFSYDEVFDAMGRGNARSLMRGMGGGGITKSILGGLNFVDTWGKITNFSANYTYRRPSTRTASKVHTENILPDRHYFTNSNSTSKNVNNSHQGDIRVEYEPDSMTRISIRPQISANNGFSRNESFTESFDADGSKINNSTRERHNKENGVNFSNRVDITRKFGTKGGYVQLEFDNSNNHQNSLQNNYTSRNIYDTIGNLQENKIQDQLIKGDQKSAEYSLEAEARIPVFGNWKLDLEYEYENNKEHNQNLFYEPGTNPDSYDVLNTSLSSNFTTRSITHRPSAGIVYRDDKFSFNLSGGFESVQLKNDEEFSNAHFDNTYNNLFTRLRIRYRIKRGQSLSMYYRRSRDIPSADMLMPVTDKTDPLFIVTGNPDLKPSLSNNFSLNYYNFDFRSHYGMRFFLRGDFTSDAPVSKTTTDAELVRTTTYTNVDGQYNISFGGGIGKMFTLRDNSTIKPHISARASVSKNIGFSNGIKYHANNFTLGPRVSLEYNIPDVINIEPSYNIDYNKSKYSLASQRDRSYTNHIASLEITSYWPKNLIFGNNFSYTHIGETAPGFDNDFFLWNMSLGYKVWGGDGIFKVKVYDVLNQNVSTTRTLGQDFIRDTQQLVLQRYMMFSFTYKFSKFGGKKMNRRGRGFRRYGGGHWRG